MDDAHLPGSPNPAGAARPPVRRGRGRGIAFQAAAVLLTVVSALAGTGLARWLRAPDIEERPAAPAVKFPNRLFQGWPKPDCVLVLTAQQHGYLLPCGCSRPQVGGLERRYNLLQRIKTAGWPYVAVDLGDIVQRHGPAGLANQQALIKYQYSMRALKEMGYAATGFGEYEVNLGLFTVLCEWALNDKQPRVVAGNLIDADKNYPDMTFPGASATAAGIKVGVTSIVSPSAAAKMDALTGKDKRVQFEDRNKTLPRLLAQMRGRGVDLPVLLYQGPVTQNNLKRPPTEAVACAEAFPQFPVVLCLCEEDQPPSQPTVVTHRDGSKSLLITLGHKGKFIGVVGVYKTGKAGEPFTFRYERAEMTEDFMTPKTAEKDHPIVKLMEDYTKELRDKNYLEKYGQVRHPVQVMPAVPGLRRPGEPTYVGSGKCKACHEAAYEKWEKTPHSHAYQTLVNATRPGNRQYDPECIVCHTVGFGYQSGYVSETRTPVTDTKRDPHFLRDVGCEACHGPASVHVANPSDLTWQRRINPWKYLPKNKQKDAMDTMCQKCHDIDNDVTWLHGGFEKKWPKIEHKTPKPAE